MGGSNGSSTRSAELYDGQNAQKQIASHIRRPRARTPVSHTHPRIAHRTHLPLIARIPRFSLGEVFCPGLDRAGSRGSAVSFFTLFRGSLELVSSFFCWLEGLRRRGRLNKSHPGPTKPKYLRTGIAVNADCRSLSKCARPLQASCENDH